MRISLDALEALEAIERHGGFTAAARALHKAQSAISYAIRQLEAQLGVTLFDRSGHRAVLTAAGRAVLAEAGAVLHRARRLEGLADRFAEGWEARLFIVLDGILPTAPVMRVLQQMAEEGVPTHIRLKMEYLGGVQDRFEREQAELMVVKDYVPGPGLSAQPLPPVRCLLVAAAEHPLARAEAPLEQADLHQHVELTVHDSSDSGRVQDVHQFGGSRVFFLSDFHTKKQAILMGLGFGWMPHYLVARELSAGTLKVLPYTPGGEYAFTPHLVHPVERPLGRAGRRFVELLLQ